jgi:hypothetical protein
MAPDKNSDIINLVDEGKLTLSSQLNAWRSYQVWKRLFGSRRPGPAGTVLPGGGSRLISKGDRQGTLLVIAQRVELSARVAAAVEAGQLTREQGNKVTDSLVQP